MYKKTKLIQPIDFYDRQKLRKIHYGSDEQILIDWKTISRCSYLKQTPSYFKITNNYSAESRKLQIFASMLHEIANWLASAWSQSDKEGEKVGNFKAEKADCYY